MSAPILSSTQAAIDEAMTASRPADVIEGVKNAVHRELEELDPRAKVQSTTYFSHSFVPDFIVTWHENGRGQRRDVYLRPSLESTLAAQDLQALGDHAPVLLSLHRPEAEALEEVARRDVDAHAPNVLLTGVAALDEFTGDSSDDEPLKALVRPNLVRGGRGLISGDTLSALHVPLTGTAADVGLLEAFSGLVRDIFVPAAATRLERAAQILEVALTGDVLDLVPAIDDDPAEQLLRGRLSDAEVDVLLPYLLSRENVTREPAFWAHLGSMLDLARLEGMGDILRGLDLTPLLAANLNTWTATRAMLALNAEDGGAPDDGQWRLMGRTIATVQGAWRVHVTADSRRLKGRDESLAARWDELAPVLRGRPVSAVALNGLQRRVNVTADQATDVLGDVSTIRDSIADEFFVPAVTVKTSRDEDASRIELDFKKMLATASSPTAVSALVELAVAVLGHRVAAVGAPADAVPANAEGEGDGDDATSETALAVEESSNLTWEA
jgi:hypothetical protein